MNEPLTLDSYQAAAVGTDVSKGDDSPSFLLLGLFGEAGSVLSEVKKHERDRTVDYRERVTEELGDVLWYLSAVAARNSITLSEIASLAIGMLPDHATVDSSLTFRDLQPRLRGIPVEPSLLLEWRLIDLAEKVGQLVYDHRLFLKKRNRAPLIESFSNVFGEILAVANRTEIELQDAALAQLRKAEERWPKTRILPTYKDDEFPEYERLPRNLEVEIREEKRGDRYFVFQRCNGINVGDRLTDNIKDPDDYRFHDVFHYAYVAVLGWSPVTRALYRLKRKSDAKVDEAEDGARAILIEEGIATLVFNEAKKNALFEGVNRGKLSFDLLKIIRKFVGGYEIQDAPYWAWEEAILEGYAAFRYLKSNRSGRLIIRDRKLSIEPL
ncbi:nucleoside triphosphate pyrophosphohydrolase family protein [Sphingomonas mesophila]|uniref:nucleoside triphosphate pyrophosphohydrolase family protein n=1 Tax=Sphingomonas mesophila TaxID=2303576 RepID=UPI000E597E43|nr:nucleoside triphosphate pyrophosphohydrolase family protein [Sphingomonas mesophila]